ncbi:MAG: glycosyltransferase family 2 protein, partial [Acutalibacteraceae bacterium]
HFTAFSRQLLDSVGYFNNEYDGSQDYDLILRLTEKAQNIVHIPKALYFWRSHKASVASDVSAKPYVIDSAKRAIKAHIERLGLSGSVEDSMVPTTYKIQYDINGNPLISIIIPNKDHINDLDKCLSSVYEKSTYKNFEIIIVENNSTEDKTFEYYKSIQNKYENLKVITWDKGFNYSAINNFAVKQAKGEYVLLLNNDIEVITPDWLEQMLMFAQRKDVGAVGAKLYYPDDTIQHAGVIVGLGGVAGHSHKYFDRTDPGYMARASIAQNLSACTAACLLVRKDVYNEVGGLDEGYAVAFNDVDFCMSIRKAGYLIVFTPFAEFYHYESKSRGIEDTAEKRARFNSEVFRFQDKWGAELKKGDPYYNPNLTLDSENFALKCN